MRKFKALAALAVVLCAVAVSGYGICMAPAERAPEDQQQLEAELKERQHELEALVKREEYEQAAACRDRILQLKEELAALDGGKNE